MKKLLAIVLIGLLHAGATNAAPTADVSDYACIEAASETLKANTPKSIRSKVIKHCKDAFKDQNHRKNKDKACDKQAQRVSNNLQFPVYYTCATAMSIAYD